MNNRLKFPENINFDGSGEYDIITRKGGNGGNGGNIRITTNDQDVHLLMLISMIEVNGGLGWGPQRDEFGHYKNTEIIGYGCNGNDGTFKYGVINEDGQWKERNEQSSLLEISDYLYKPQ